MLFLTAGANLHPFLWSIHRYADFIRDDRSPTQNQFVAESVHKRRDIASNCRRRATLPEKQNEAVQCPKREASVDVPRKRSAQGSDNPFQTEPGDKPRQRMHGHQSHRSKSHRVFANSRFGMRLDRRGNNLLRPARHRIGIPIHQSDQRRERFYGPTDNSRRNPRHLLLTRIDSFAPPPWQQSQNRPENVSAYLKHISGFPLDSTENISLARLYKASFRSRYSALAQE